MNKNHPFESIRILPTYHFKTKNKKVEAKMMCLIGELCRSNHKPTDPIGVLDPEWIVGQLKNNAY